MVVGMLRCPLLLGGLWAIIADDDDSESATARARALTPPVPNASQGGEFEDAGFFEANGDLFRAAWQEHSLADERMSRFSVLADVSPLLAEAVAALRTQPSHTAEGVLPGLDPWTFWVPSFGYHLPFRSAKPDMGWSPATAATVRKLCNETAPGVFSIRLLHEEAIASMRAELARVAASGIPTRRPNGMNRWGVILDEDVDGAVSHGLSTFVKALVDEYVRPLARMLFSDIVRPGDDSEQFAFTVQYEPDKDAKLAEHRDASVVTLNMNLNTPSESFGGSALDFVDPHDPKTRHTVEFTPGIALIHRGSLRHAALPITKGVRENLIVWLFGEDGYVREAPYPEAQRLSVKERWGRGGPAEGRATSCRGPTGEADYPWPLAPK